MKPLPNLIQVLYKNALQPFLFGLNAETAHNWSVNRLKQIERIPLALKTFSKALVVEDPRLTVSIGTLTCPNPVGLAAGFDKGADLLNILPRFGFGFIEVGTFTPLTQQGQKKPRLFRFKKDRALINRMGFNNPGILTAVENLKKRSLSFGVPVGANIGKGRDTSLEEAVEDYVTSFDHVYPYSDYLVLNVSSPNTPNLRHLQAPEYLKIILQAITTHARSIAEKTAQPMKPIFLKVSPDVDDAMLEDIARLGIDLKIGFVATNTTIDHSLLKFSTRREEGGLSGRPLKEKSNRILKRLYKLTRGIVPIIGVGGIFNADDAYEKIRLGASLVQVYTGWIYEGPALVPQINQGLLKLMTRDGFKNIKDAVGTL